MKEIDTSSSQCRDVYTSSACYNVILLLRPGAKRSCKHKFNFSAKKCVLWVFSIRLFRSVLQFFVILCSLKNVNEFFFLQTSLVFGESSHHKNTHTKSHAMLQANLFLHKEKNFDLNVNCKLNRWQFTRDDGSHGFCCRFLPCSWFRIIWMNK